MTPEIATLKGTISSLRAALIEAEATLATLYGPRVDSLANLLCSCFDAGGVTRFVRYTLGDVASRELPTQGSLNALARASAVAFAEADTTRDDLRAMLLRERPHRTRDIDSALKDWGTP